jgi:hypothetical protein
MYSYLYVYMYIYIYYIETNAQINECKGIHMIFIYVCVNMRVIYVCMFVYMYVCDIYIHRNKCLKKGM